MLPDGFDSRFLDVAELKKAKADLSADALLPTLQDGRKLVRVNALNALSVLGEDASSAIFNIALCLRDPEPEVAIAAARALATLKPTEPSIVLAMFNALPDAKRQVLPALREALEALGTLPVQVLLEQLQSKPQPLLRAARVATPWLCDQLAKPLVKMLSHDSHKARAAATQLLGTLGPALESVQNELMQALDTTGRESRVPLIRALAQTEPTKMLVQWLRSLWAIDSSQSTRQALRSAFEGFDLEVPEEVTVEE